MMLSPHPQLLAFLGLLALGTVHGGSVQLDQGNCPQFWFSFNNRCYKYSPTLMSWNDAEKNCQSQGGHLVSIHNQEEHNYVLKLVQTYTPSQIYTWIGLHDYFFEGGWNWSDGSDVKYTNWHRGNPNGGTSQQCVFTHYGSTRQWADYGCTSRLPSVCVYAVHKHVLIELNM